MLGEQHPPAGLADLVPGAADALQGAGHAGRRLDLDHQVDRAHVDPELEAAGGDHGRQPPALEVVLDEGALLLGDGAVVGLGDDRLGAVRLPGLRHDLRRRRPAGLEGPAGARGRDLVEPGGQPLGQPPRVGEHDRGAVPLDEVDHALLDVRPDAGAAGRVAAVLVVLVRRGHVLDRHHHAEVPGLLARRRDDLHRRRATEEAGHLLQGPDGGGEADALGGPLEERVEPLEAQRQVGAALAPGDGVHLVDDHRLDAAEGLARLAGEDQEQRLGGGDQHVGRVGRQRAPLRGRGVTGPDTDPHLGQGATEALGGVTDPGQRRPQVALHVDRQRLERRDVEHPAALLLVVGPLPGQQAVDRPQERAEGLAGAGGRHHERVPAGPDGLPRPFLGRRRCRESRTEPGAGRLAEPVERTHRSILAHGTDNARVVRRS